MNPVSYLKTRRRLNLALIIAYTALIFASSSIPQGGLPGDVSAYTPMIHLLEYAVLGFLLFPYAGFYPAVLLASLYGVSDEVHQLFVAGRDASFVDVLADFTGSLLGAHVSRRML